MFKKTDPGDRQHLLTSKKTKRNGDDAINNCNDQNNTIERDIAALDTGKSEKIKIFKMQRNIGLWTGVCIIIGNVIGSGIFISPKGVLMHTGSIGLSLAIWIFCGVVSMLGALSYAELGTSYNMSGGGYHYIYETIGELPAFLALWISCLASSPTGTVIIAMTFANYLVYGMFSYSEPPNSAVRLISAMLCTFLCAVNIYSVRWSIRIQSTTVFGKLFALIMIMVAGAVHMISGNVSNLSPDHIFDGSVTNPGQIALAVYAGMFAYSGWEALNVLVEELREPHRLLPLCIVIALPLITLVYVLTNVAYFSALRADELLQSPAVAVTFAHVTLGALSVLMPLFVAVSTFGTVNGIFLSGSRIMFVAGRKSHLPKTLGMINMNYLTPVPALLMMCATSLIMLLGQDVYKLITYVGFLDALSMVTPLVGMLIQRYKDPTRERPFRVWTVVPVIYILIYILLLILPWYHSPIETGIGLCLLLSGIPAYLVGVKYQNKPEWFNTLSDKLCRLIQKLTLSISEDESTEEVHCKQYCSVNKDDGH